MKLGIMQPYLFPYIGYWQLINAVDVYVIYDDVNYIKRGYINRNYFLHENKSKRFALETKGASSKKFINEVMVGESAIKILKMIRYNYAKAPNFNKVYPIVEEILLNEEKNLAKFIGNSIMQISKYLKINTKFEYSSNIKKDNNLKGQEKILDICKKMGATHYINAIGGKNLYNKDMFEEQGISLSFLKAGSIFYKQFNNDFVPNLSIIDIMMFNSEREIEKILKNFNLS